MTDQHEPPVKPTTGTTSNSFRRRNVGVFVAILTVAGIVGLLVSLDVFSCNRHENDSASPLRGSGTGLACPTQVPHLNEEGIVTEQEDVSFNMDDLAAPPSCANDQDPQAGRYWEWTAPEDGKVTLAAWTVWVTPVCECVTSTSTVNVQTGQVLRVWTPVDEGQPIQFEQSSTQVSCPILVPFLEAAGTVKDEDFVVATASNVPPSCANAQDPMRGRYYKWEATASGQVTLAPWTVLMEASSSCDCITTASTIDVVAGQVYRVWTPIEEAQPIRTTGQNPTTILQCPETVPFLQDNGAVDLDLPELEAMDTHMTPSCAHQDDPLEGIYLAWQAPAAGQATLAPWTVLVDTATCECVTTVSTFDVVANEIYRIWTPADEIQPIQFIE